MRPTRLLASLATGALVAVPGFALAAQGGPPVETPPGETPVTPEVAEVEEDEEPDLEEAEVEQQVEDEELGDEGIEDEGHGEAISALAQCLPSGAELHGTGITKGHIMSQAASTGEVELPNGDVVSIEEACEEVQDLADGAAPPETAKGRPNWAGPKDDGVEEDAAVEGAEADDAEGDREPGPPEHAGKGKAKDKARGRG